MKKLFNIVLLGLLILALLGCMFEPYEPACEKGDPILGQACPELYDPVCAPDGTTYSNLCYAIKDGWETRCIEQNECED